MEASSASARQACKVHWMEELRAVFPCGLIEGIGDEPETFERRINVGTKFRVLPRKNRCISRRISHNDISKIKLMDFINEVKNMSGANITKTPNFIRISLSSMK